MIELCAAGCGCAFMLLLMALFGPRWPAVLLGVIIAVYAFCAGLGAGR